MAAFTRMAAEVDAVNLNIIRRSQAVVNANIKKQFTKSHPKGTDTPSAPGEPPAIVTGTLRRSITSSRPRIRGGHAVGEVYPSVVYGRIQELGGTAGRGAVLPARPYAGPGLEQSKERIGSIALEEWGRVTRRG